MYKITFWNVRRLIFTSWFKKLIKKSETASSLEPGENSTQTRSELDLLSAKAYEINL